jgi:polyisoprenyl-phosphate glycosyltransferase
MNLPEKLPGIAENASPGDACPTPLLSVITPAFNEENNLAILRDRLQQVMETAGLDWEWIIVDDHSTDGTPAVIRKLAEEDSHVRGVRFSRNCGGHTAISCGLALCRGACAAILASDLQDPPEMIPRLYAEWKKGVQVVMAVRTSREGETASTLFFSRLFYMLMRRTTALRDMPPAGADFFLIDRVVIDAIQKFSDSSNIFAVLVWLGFRQSTVHYDKKQRQHGQSGWSLRKKIRLVVDSIICFTHFPIRLMTYCGFICAIMGFAYAGYVIYHALDGAPAEGWPSVMVAIMVIGGLQMTMLGMLGEYLWRALEAARQRPAYTIEETMSRAPGAPRQGT